jgi:hypothetical protein
MGRRAVISTGGGASALVAPPTQEPRTATQVWTCPVPAVNTITAAQIDSGACADDP